MMILVNFFQCQTTQRRQASHWNHFWPGKLYVYLILGWHKVLGEVTAFEGHIIYWVIWENWQIYDGH